ncbi:MAG: ATP-binding cassette domain-containing protein [Rhodobacteraceae bacterium]|nr:ATP-binding cassette domain-containing protein [Paracoccaceae bacterium]
MTSNSIEIKDVSHVYKTQTGPLPVLDRLSISVPKNGFTAVVGPSGCGKSTLTRLIAGLMTPDSGSVWLFGEKVEQPRSTVTGLLITHDLRESVFLSDQVIVLSGRPARAQYILDIPNTGARSLDDLYTPEAIMMLNDLRHQIKVAQERN